MELLGPDLVPEGLEPKDCRVRYLEPLTQEEVDETKDHHIEVVLRIIEGKTTDQTTGRKMLVAEILMQQVFLMMSEESRAQLVRETSELWPGRELVRAKLIPNTGTG